MSSDEPTMQDVAYAIGAVTMKWQSFEGEFESLIREVLPEFGNKAANFVDNLPRGPRKPTIGQILARFKSKGIPIEREFHDILIELIESRNTMVHRLPLEDLVRSNSQRLKWFKEASDVAVQIHVITIYLSGIRYNWHNQRGYTLSWKGGWEKLVKRAKIDQNVGDLFPFDEE